MNRIILGDNLAVLKTLPTSSVHLIYIDPPFNTGRQQSRTTLTTVRDEDGGDRIGFGGRRYRTEAGATMAFADAYDDFLAFLKPRLIEAHRVLTPSGALYVHLDYREVHYVKVMLDGIFGRANFLNEIIWAYDYGGRTRRKWPPKHDTILYYARDADNYVFNTEAIDRIPYMAPGLVGPEKAARGKLPTDCYSADTDLLTTRGWVAFPDLKPSDEVASVSLDGELGFFRPVALQRYAYQGEMYEFATQTINLLVTPEHQLYVRPKHGRSYGFRPASSVGDLTQARSSYYALLNTLRWSGEARVPDTFDVPPCDYRNPWSSKPLPSFDLGDWCEFMGWYLAEGSTTFYRDRAEVMIAQQKSEHRQRIAQLLHRMKLRHHTNARAFIICNKQLAVYLKQFGHAFDKFIPHDLLTLFPAHLQRLFDGLMAGDGHRRRNEWIYVTTSPQLANDVQELLIKLGHNSNISLRPRPEEHPNWRPAFAVSCRVSRESTIWPDRHVRIVPYNDDVYCCTVEPYHTLIVRRQGKAAVCGNCWWQTIVSPTGREKTGYPTQKPLAILRRIILASSRPGEVVLDFFAGSGTTGVAAHELGRRFILIDNNPAALDVMARRFPPDTAEFIGHDPPPTP